MNASVRSSHPGEGMLGNSTWDYNYYQQNYSASAPLMPDKTGTSKPAACEQLHIAVEVRVEPRNQRKLVFDSSYRSVY